MRALGFAGLVLLAATAASADPCDEALSAMLRCSGTGDKAQRLACYDSAVVRVPGALDGFNLSSDDANSIVMKSRVKIGWIEADPVAEEEIPDEGATENSEA